MEPTCWNNKNCPGKNFPRLGYVPITSSMTRTLRSRSSFHSTLYFSSSARTLFPGQAWTEKLTPSAWNEKLTPPLLAQKLKFYVVVHIISNTGDNEDKKGNNPSKANHEASTYDWFADHEWSTYDWFAIFPPRNHYILYKFLFSGYLIFSSCFLQLLSWDSKGI